MGGVAPLVLILFSAGIIWAIEGIDWPSFFPLAAMALGGLVGFLDDLRSQRGRRSIGFFPHQTILAQFVAALVLVVIAAPYPQTLRLPFSSHVISLPAWGWAPLLILAFLGTVNGLNLADGLDGLATGLFLLSVLGFMPLSLPLPELGALSLIGLGAGLGFLWTNIYPARVFLGNVGAMGLGGFLFGLAWSTGGVLFLPLVGGVFVLEAISDALQVGTFKLTGVRLFKMSPFHHHLEDGPVTWPHRLKSPNWPEPKVVARLWILGAACALFGLLATLN